MNARRVTSAILAALLLASCDTKPNPRKHPKPKPTIDAVAVKICIDIATQVRRPDFWCDPVVDGHRWAYPYNTPEWAGVELPAVGEPLRAGWGFPHPPAGMEATPPPRIPEEGAVFKR
jgi:hypothetical protein